MNAQVYISLWWPCVHQLFVISVLLCWWIHSWLIPVLIDLLVRRCEFLNFASKKKCLRCSETRPMGSLGDWYCPKWVSIIFLSFTKLDHSVYAVLFLWVLFTNWLFFNCRCDFFNFGKNKECLKCNSQRPLETTRARGEDHEWIRPSWNIIALPMALWHNGNIQLRFDPA